MLRQWRGRSRRATAAAGFSQAFCRGYSNVCVAFRKNIAADLSGRMPGSMFPGAPDKIKQCIHHAAELSCERRNGENFAWASVCARKRRDRSALQQRIDLLLEFLDRGFALDDF